MATSLFRTKGSQFFNNAGAPLAGGFIYYYEATTTTLQNTFSDAAGAVPNTNPLELDAYGRLQTSVYFGDGGTYSNYKELLTDADAVTISNWPIDNLPAATPAAAAASTFAYPSVPWETVTSASSPVIMVIGDAGSAYEADTTGGSVTFNLPSALTIGLGKGFFFKKTSDANSMIWHPSGVEEIDGVNVDYAVTRGQSAFWVTTNGAGWKITAASYKMPPVSLGGFKNLVATNNSVAPMTKVDINADNAILVGSDLEYIVTGVVDITIDSGATGVNGLDTGTMAVSTWYHNWVISNGTTTSGLMSLSSSAPTMPSGYTYKEYAGAIYNTASLGFIRILQVGNKTNYRVVTSSSTPTLPLLSSGVVTTWTAVSSLGTYVPSTAKTITILLMANQGNSIQTAAPNNSYGSAGTMSNPPPCVVSSNGSYQSIPSTPFTMAIESSSIATALYVGSNSAQCQVNLIGWTDSVNAT